MKKFRDQKVQKNQVDRSGIFVLWTLLVSVQHIEVSEISVRDNRSIIANKDEYIDFIKGLERLEKLMYRGVHQSLYTEVN